MQKHIVLGGTGHLGNVLIKTLLEQNKKVKAIVLEHENLEPLKDLDIEIVYGNILDKNFLLKEIEKDAFVYHLAGIVDIGSANKNMMYEVNVEGTKNVIDTCIEIGVKRLLYTSSVHTIEVKRKDSTLLEEPTSFNYKKVKGTYAKTKTIATKYLFDKIKEKNLDAVVVYPSGIIGPFDYKLSNFGQLIYNYMNGKIKARVKGSYNFVDVRDVSLGITSAMEKGISGEGYLLSGEIVSVNALFNILEKYTNIKKPPKLEMWFLKPLSIFAELYYKIRHEKPIFSPYSLYTLECNSNFSNKKAKEQLGFKTRPIEDSIKDALVWFNENRSNL